MAKQVCRTRQSALIASIHLAKHVLTQCVFPSLTPNPLVNPDRLRSSRILELGAGTGLLSILLSPLCAEYIASDRYENLRLLQRNLELNGINHLDESVRGKSSAVKDGRTGLVQSKKVRIEEVDWKAISAERKKIAKAGDWMREEEDVAETFDMVLAVDCVYNEALVQPLVDTLARYCSPGGRTMVWVVAELRSSDVVS